MRLFVIGEATMLPDVAVAAGVDRTHYVTERALRRRGAAAKAVSQRSPSLLSSSQCSDADRPTLWSARPGATPPRLSSPETEG